MGSCLQQPCHIQKTTGSQLLLANDVCQEEECQFLHIWSLIGYACSFTHVNTRAALNLERNHKVGRRKWGLGYGRSWRENTWDGFDQNTLYSCTKFFSKNALSETKTTKRSNVAMNNYSFFKVFVSGP